MLDLAFIRNHPAIVKEAARVKYNPIDIDYLLEVDRQVLELQRRVEEARAGQKKISIRGLGLHDDGESKRQETRARLIAAQAALARLDELASHDEVSQESVQHLRKHYEARVHCLTKRYKQSAGEPGEDPEMTYQQLQQGALQAERSAVIGLRNQGEINDEVLDRIERELDLEEQQLAGEAGKT